MFGGTRSGDLDRWSASVSDLISNYPNPADQSSDNQVCTEPFCGGFHWASTSNKAGSGRSAAIASGSSGAGSNQPLHSSALHPGILSKRPRAEEHSSPVPVQIDFTNVQFFPALNPPIAKMVKIQPANSDRLDWWNISNAKQVVIRKPSERRFLAEQVLSPFMRVAHTALLGGKRIPQGLQLVSIKPRGGQLRVTPFLGGKEQLKDAKLPFELTFGGDSPEFANRGVPYVPLIAERPNHYSYHKESIILPVKRLDLVIRKPELNDLRHSSAETRILEQNHVKSAQILSLKRPEDLAAGESVFRGVACNLYDHEMCLKQRPIRHYAWSDFL
eukprot:TRINITY_DN7597_c2_g3_i5.p1 TRINITY_DN7597_c2_g3~~TRINITY_DN7597_c2_g3_i5.p1  ORF type:complete len:330 (+),score=32.52 TRINITY_DN7597_c2_g3_i5:209-1198(+)